MNTRILFATSLMLMIASALLFAQGPPNGPGLPSPQAMVQSQVRFLTTVLSLSKSQQQQATTIFTSVANPGSLHDDLKNAHENLSAAIKANDVTAINEAAAAIGNIFAQITAARAKADAALYQILTPEQQNKFNQLENEGPGRFMGGGPAPF